ncbi:Syntaxin-124 [Dichanthelium oligosanthes]|uniref:Syntaxin-124 n=1 Tax=Dichanthelium oligosanthes TaxID=888268 RepID=A0A1E5VVY2_9POAL|nr:Syntaxin-124 [Dichanthelium oligosanthes]
MNDLFTSGSFKKYADLKQQAALDDLEAGVGGEVEGPDLDRFFEDVEVVKEDLRGLEALHRRLQSAHEEGKTAHDAGAVKALRARTDADAGQVLRRAKAVKGRLEALDRANAASRKLPGCGPGSSTDRTRTSVVTGLGKKLKDLMDDFQGLRTRMAAEYKETVARRYYTVTGEKADDSTVESLISSGASETLLQKAIQQGQGQAGAGRGQVLDTVSEIQERHDAVLEMERSLRELHQVFLDMAALVEAQGHQLNDIESHVARASSFVLRGAVELETAREYQKGSRKWACVAVVAGAVLVAVIVLPIVVYLHLLTVR